eukprot:c24212_g1_i2 orf=411-626(+)
MVSSAYQLLQLCWTMLLHSISSIIDGGHSFVNDRVEKRSHGHIPRLVKDFLLYILSKQSKQKQGGDKSTIF